MPRKPKQDQYVTVPMFEKGITEVRKEIRGEVGSLEKRMDNRFEKQEVMIEERFQRFSQDVTSNLDKRFNKASQELQAQIDARFDRVSEEMKQHMEVLVENTRAEVGEPYQDKLDLVAQKVATHEQRITALENS